jgi:fatty-acyl-CoA synthase
MGLVGILLSSITAMGPKWGGDTLTLLRPEDFVRNPWRWIETLHETGANLTAGPDFGYRMAAKTGLRKDSIDLSRLECCIVGAELVRAATLNAFEAAFSPAGFRSTSFCPAYGMAEAGVAVAMVPPFENWTSSTVDRDGQSRTLVSCGPVLAGYECSFEPGDSGDEILVRGPSIAEVYANGQPAVDGQGFFHTRDQGYIENGELYVEGRLDDVLVVRGRNLSAPHLEQAISDAGACDDGAAVVLQDSSGDLVIVLESRGKSGAGTAKTATSAVLAHSGVRAVRVEVLAKGELPRTTSGKPRRQEMRRMFL